MENLEMSKKAQRMAILQITPEMLRELLQLPDGAQILDFRVPIDYNGVLEVKIIGAGWPVLEGQALIRTTGVATLGKIDWYMPSKTSQDEGKL